MNDDKGQFSGGVIAETIKAVELMRIVHRLDIEENILCRLNAQKDKLEDHKKMSDRPPKVVQKKDYLQYISEPPPLENLRISAISTCTRLTRI